MYCRTVLARYFTGYFFLLKALSYDPKFVDSLSNTEKKGLGCGSLVTLALVRANDTTQR